MSEESSDYFAGKHRRQEKLLENIHEHLGELEDLLDEAPETLPYGRASLLQLYRIR